MAIVFLPLNGIGWGHMSRAHAIAAWLRRRGYAPVIFAQGHYPDFMAASIPGTSIGTIYKAGFIDRRKTRVEISDYARLTTPSIVIEDTHPAPIFLPTDINRVLLIRPLSMPKLRRLRVMHESSHRLFLIVDHPESPTWPFSQKETVELQGWPRWFSLGPIYRESSDDGIEQMRRKYAITPDRKVYVFSMGAGGVQPGVRGEHESFCARAQVVAEKIQLIDARSRFLFVRGGLFPKEFRLPPLFEDLAVEPQLPDLMAAASGAVIRPTYNAIWECIRGRTPFVPITGVTHHEPVDERVHRLKEHGLLADDVTLWQDSAWMNNFNAQCDRLAKRFSLANAAEQLCSLAVVPNPTPTKPRPFTHQAAPHLNAGRTFPLPIRIHAVSEITDDLLTALQVCASRGLKVSLDVIPYLCRTDEAALKAATNPLSFEIAQHGFAGVPRCTDSGQRSEFVDPQQSEKELQLGLEIIRRLFPTTFHGGLSASFDAVPNFLPDLWSTMGGVYLSGRTPLRKQFPPQVQLTISPWSWRARAPLGLRSIVTEAKKAVSDRGYAGLIVDVRQLRSARAAEWLSKVIDRLIQIGGTPALVSELASK
jgi:hypothetical protein